MFYNLVFYNKEKERKLSNHYEDPQKNHGAGNGTHPLPCLSSCHRLLEQKQRRSRGNEIGHRQR